tara:strand:+ start:3479 stop:4426 length:948 start_codon:yes stop_codon:yes gene_type:complete
MTEDEIRKEAARLHAQPDLFGGDTIKEKRSKLKARLAKMEISKPLPAPRYRVLNLGAGVQSCALALMSARGDLERLDFAIFADTGWERKATYRYLDWLDERVPFEILRVSREGLDLGEYAMEGADLPQKGRPQIPFHLTPSGVMAKQCSKEFKTRVVHAKLREILGLERGQHGPREPVVEQWLGMTSDELYRVSVSEKAYLHHRYPLIEKRMSRADMYPWFEQRQLPIPPSSSCIFCPLQPPAHFEAIMASEDRDRLIGFDRAIRKGYLGMTGSAYLTAERKPIDECTFGSAASAGQEDLDYDEIHGCGDGECGV